MHSTKFRLFALGWIVLLAAPFVVPHYALSLLNLAMINLILVASLNMLMGYSGQLSLAHAGFFGTMIMPFRRSAPIRSAPDHPPVAAL